MKKNRVDSDIILKLDNVSYIKKHKCKDKVILDDISLNIKENSIVLITGENGSGKSTLLKIMSALIKPTKGVVNSLKSSSVIFQEADSNILGDTPLSDVLFSLNNSKIKKEEKLILAEDMLKKFNLEHLKDSPSFFLSGGEKRRLSIASNLVLSQGIIMFDEPYSNLDYKSIKELNKIFLTLKKENKTIIIVSHEIEKCLSLCDKVVVLKEGRIVFDAHYSDESFVKNLERWGVHNPLLFSNDINSLVWI